MNNNDREPLGDRTRRGVINKTYDRLNFVSQDKEVLRNYHLREMALSDWTTGVNTAREKGIEEGMEKGMFVAALSQQKA